MCPFLFAILIKLIVTLAGAIRLACAQIQTNLRRHVLHTAKYTILHGGCCPRPRKGRATRHAASMELCCLFRRPIWLSQSPLRWRFLFGGASLQRVGF